MRRKKKDLRSELEKKAEERYFEMSDGVKVRVLDFNLAENPHEYILFFIPGFVTVFQSWEKVLISLSKEFRILYFESREKVSSIMPNRKTERSITLHKMAHDIKEVIKQLNLDAQKYITICSSTGGTIEVEALSEGWLNPAGAIMVGPTMEYRMKFIAAFLVTILPEVISRMLMFLFRWYMGVVYIDKKKHPEQYAKYVRAGEEAKIRKIRRVLWQMRKYQCWDMAPKIKVNCLLIGASTDKMHATEETFRVHKLIPDSKFIDLESNEATHSDPLIDTMKNYLSEIENEK